MKIYLATWLSDRSLGKSLTKRRASRRLLSFFFIRYQEISDELFNQYVDVGQCDPRKGKDK